MSRIPKLPAAAPPAPRAPRGARRRPIGLAGLRGFAAAAQHLSFTLAAEDLHLTQSAISRQVSGLEREVGQKLFVRKTRALALTPAGSQLYRAVREGVASIDRSVEQIRGVSATPRVSVTTYKSFASLWLVPRLASFQRAHPTVEIRIDASDHVVDVDREGVDLALRRARHESAPRGAVHLLDEVVTPIMSPELLQRFAPQGIAPADLLRMPLIDIDSVMPNDPDSWDAWFELAGIEREDGGHAGMLFVGYSDQSIQAAARGQGVALAQSPLYFDMVLSGQLVAPFPSICLKSGYRMVLVENARTRTRPEVAQLKEWLLAQFRQYEGPLKGSAGRLEEKA
jgi:DNA-binding transcriptional LysR family regulator